MTLSGRFALARASTRSAPPELVFGHPARECVDAQAADRRGARHRPGAIGSTPTHRPGGL